MESSHLASSYMYDNSFLQPNEQHAMSNGTLSHMNPYESYGHAANGQRYVSSYQTAVMPSHDKCWDENVSGINEEFMNLKSNDLSISVYHRFNGNNASSSDMSHEGSMPPCGQHYLPGAYSNSYSCQTTPMYPSFQAPIVASGGSTSTSGPSQGHSRSLYMPPTPPSSEPGSPSTQQQMQSRPGATVARASHQLKQSSGPIHTTGPCLAADSIQTPSTRKQSPPPFSCANGKPQQALAHFTEGAQVPPISSSVHLSGTIPVPFGQQPRHCGPSGEESKVSHSSPLFPNSATRLTPGQHYNVSSVAQITATVHPRYNRRNNPELEKRRIHRCDFPG